jgi:hypothetical protein
MPGRHDSLWAGSFRMLPQDPAVSDLAGPSPWCSGKAAPDAFRACQESGAPPQVREILRFRAPLSNHQPRGVGVAVQGAITSRGAAPTARCTREPGPVNG